MQSLDDHPRRYALNNELHARPFPELRTAGTAAFLALKSPDDTATSNRPADRARLIALLDRYGAPHPQPDATHFAGQIGRYRLKWEQHTEFQTYTIFSEDQEGEPFDSRLFDVFPPDWLALDDSVRVTSALVHIAPVPAPETVAAQLAQWFVPESLSVSHVLDRSAIVATDFRIDPRGHVRFVVLPEPTTGPQRIGRIVQRLTEIETYKTMSMLGFARARDVSAVLNDADRRLSALVGDMRRSDVAAERTLTALLATAAELENLTAAVTYRFGASAAYEALVNQRIDVLREERFLGRQTFAEFMLRRYDPAMRTIRSTRSRLAEMTQAAARAGDLLRTRVDVERSAQNQALLHSMDRRADQQLKLQRTVEGLSVVAISYYAVSLLSYVVYPMLGGAGMSKPVVMALLTPIVVLGVWAMLRRLRHD